MTNERACGFLRPAIEERWMKVGRMAFAIPLAVLLVSLSLGSLGDSVVPVAEAASASTYYVSPWGSDNVGVGTEENPWRTISRAVSAAAGGDTIKVMDDNNEATDDYVENVGVSKSLIIEGYDSDGANPQVKAGDPDRPVFELSADNATLRGLDIYGVSSYTQYGISLLFCSRCTVEQNRVGWDSNHNNERGIGISGGGNNCVRQNFFRYFNYCGVWVDASHFNTISNNTLSDARSSGGAAILLQNATSNTIAGNNVSRNLCLGIGTGFGMAYGVQDNVIYLNRLSDNLGGNASGTNMVTNIWHSSTKMRYTYKAGTYTGYLGNYFDDYYGVDDGTDNRTAGDGVGDTKLPYSPDPWYLVCDSYPLVDGSADAYRVLGEVTSIPAPLAGYSASVTWGVAPLTAHFTDESKGDGIASWQWDFGDGQTSTDQNPSHTYGTMGVYTVSLTVSNSGGSHSVTKERYILVIDALVWHIVSPDTDSVVETPEGTITLAFPAGAVSTDTNVIVKRLSEDETPPTRSGYRYGDTRFSVEGADNLEKEVTICIRYTDADLAAAGGEPDKLALSYYDEAVEEWVIVDTTVDTAAGTLTANTSHFSKWSVMGQDVATGSGFPLWGWVLSGIAGILVIVVIAGLFGLRYAKRQAAEVKPG